jgi:L-iditol 2-dehydrogenase
MVTADHTLKQEEAPVYAPAKGEVLLHIKATGVCGSDIHFWKAGRIGSLVVEGDCILGHEAAGVVLRCGEGVSNLRPGTSSMFAKRPENARVRIGSADSRCR